MKQAIIQFLDEDNELSAYYINEEGWARIEQVAQFLLVMCFINIDI